MTAREALQQIIEELEAEIAGIKAENKRMRNADTADKMYNSGYIQALSYAHNIVKNALNEVSK
jgi:hypothetical protein